ncbi:hypothetical protein [Mycobacterium marinum]|uniref:hypothetical protein n=1 Tax=Mycobacterium marinum TaxID=1781 RepID=UPI00115E7A9A|nr:hypothetical protein [Mycobacterium marinum]
MSDRNDELHRLIQQLDDALGAGRSDEARRLTDVLRAQLASPTGSPSSHVPPSSAHDGPLAFDAPPTLVPVRKKPAVRGSARQAVAGALAEIGVASRARLVADYAEARFGERVETRAFAGIRRDERRAWDKGSTKPSYIVPALEGRFYQPIRGLLALSDWPLERRLIGPWSERADHLSATAQLARQLAWLNERDPQGARRLAPVVASMARSIPGAVDGGIVDTARVEAGAEAERIALAANDEPWRREAAARARGQLTEEQQLWGTNVGIVSDGSQEAQG